VLGVVEGIEDLISSARRQRYTIRWQGGVVEGEVERVTEEELEEMLLSSVHPYSALGVRTCACVYCASCVVRRGQVR
jgi:hypothetical protein